MTFLENSLENIQDRVQFYNIVTLKLLTFQKLCLIVDIYLEKFDSFL